MKYLCFALALSALVGVKSYGIEDAIKSLSSQMQMELEKVLGGFPVLQSLIEAFKCVQKETSPDKYNFCNFSASFDPFELMEKCAKGPFKDFILNTVKHIPVTKLNFGVPNTVSKERCFKKDPVTVLLDLISPVLVKFG